MANNIWRYITGTLRFFLLDFGISQLLRVFQTKRGDTLEVRLSKIPDTLKIRPTKADVLVLWQTFGLNQCVLKHVSSPQLIVDAGANIGCTALFFAMSYPKATIIAVEPNTQNAELARRNCRTYQNVRIVEGAVWNQAKMLEIENPNGESWAFRMRERSIDETSEGIRGYTIGELSNGAGIDILKVDIEGGEKQLFQYDTHWLARVQTMLVEVHGKECRNVVVQAAQKSGFRALPPQGEYIVYAR